MNFITPPLIDLSSEVIEQIRFRVVRDGVVTPGVKYLRASRSLNSGSQLDIGLEALDGEFTPYVRIPLQVLADQATWLVVVEDTTAPAKVFAQSLVMAAGGTYTINVLTGSGSEATTPATVDALVRLDGLPAAREVLVVERKLDGDWRVAGYGASDAAGTVTVDLDVSDGALYALGLDDFGIPFSPGLSVPVGRRIRPSLFTGVLYQITEPGVLPGAEPTWWPITSEGSRELGTARAVAVRYYRPLAHGPVPIEML